MTSVFIWSITIFYLLTMNKIYGMNIQNIPHVTWYRIDLIFYRSFPCSDKRGSKIFPGCKVVSDAVTGEKNRMRCQEHITLLRPASFVMTWDKEQKITGYINLNLKEFNLINVQAHIVAIKPFMIDSSRLNLLHENKSFITAVFVLHTPYIRQYSFKSIANGEVSKINVTPEHLFYAVNRKAFVPISEITAADRLITDAGNEVRLLCRGSWRHRCSQPRWPMQIKRVYNLEVYREHTYFVGSLHLYVHNICQLAKTLQTSINHLIKVDKERAYLNLTSDDDVQQAIDALSAINKIKVDVKTALTVSQMTAIPLPVDKIEFLLDTRKLFESPAPNLEALAVQQAERVEEVRKQLGKPYTPEYSLQPVKIPNDRRRAVYLAAFQQLFSVFGSFTRGGAEVSVRDIFRDAPFTKNLAVIRTYRHAGIVVRVSDDTFYFTKYSSGNRALFLPENSAYMHNGKISVYQYLMF